MSNGLKEQEAEKERLSKEGLVEDEGLGARPQTVMAAWEGGKASGWKGPSAHAPSS